MQHYSEFKTVDEAVEKMADGDWPTARAERLYMFMDCWVSSSMNKSSSPDDGFGWCGLHTTESSGAVSSSGCHRSKRRAFYMKECRPFVVKLMVWDQEKALAFAKRCWNYLTDEERKDLDNALRKVVVQSIDLKKAREESKFAQWSERVALAA
jgi:hypothetical protein